MFLWKNAQLSIKVFCVIFKIDFLMETDANEFIVHSVTLSLIKLVTVDMQIIVIYTSGSPEQYLFYLH